jgi:hypothetical protein
MCHEEHPVPCGSAYRDQSIFLFGVIGIREGQRRPVEEDGRGLCE